MADYIKREDALNKLLSYAKQVDNTNTLGAMIGTIMRDVPAADVRPVVHARWDFKGQNAYHKFFVCTNCKELVDGQPRYCPNCGAMMDGEG